LNKFKKKNLLLTGGNGLLSYFWAQATEKEYTPILLENKTRIKYPNRSVISISEYSKDSYMNEDSWIKCLIENSIDIVVNTLALTNIETCEKFNDEAIYCNVKTPQFIGLACFKLNIPLIHISTDHLYSDNKKFFKEEDETILLNFYAKSKFEGEVKLQEVNSKALICRTNFFGCGPIHRNSFSDWIINSLLKKESIELFSDVLFNPLSGIKLSKIAHKLIYLKKSGIFNISSDNYMSKYSFGVFLAKNNGLNNQFLIKKEIESRPDLVKRPKIMMLSNEKLKLAIKENIGKVEDHIKNLNYQIQK
tara:strand:- start:589 stop:1506 length:918 start_codon:yes stop_codon:yes gene_type:complete